jgi:hypothetical protein
MVTRSMVTGARGRSMGPVGTSAMAWTTSIPSRTRPKIEYCFGSRCPFGPATMKNWLPLVWGPALAMARVPSS